MKVGFIGLGNLGHAMAERLISQKVDLVVWNRTPGKAEDLDAEVAASPAEVTEQCETVFINVFDSQAVDEVLSGDNGILSIDCADKVIIDTTTNHFDAVSDFNEAVNAAGGKYLEAPIYGSVAPALKGALTIVVSGERTVFDDVKPMLDHLGANIFFLGDFGLATKMKLINNMVLGSFMATLAEAVSFGEAIGLDREKTVEILDAAAGKSLVLTAKRDKLIEGDFAAHFAVKAIYKDLHQMQDLARSLQRPVFATMSAKELFGMCRAAGFEDDDFSAVYKIFQK